MLRVTILFFLTFIAASAENATDLVKAARQQIEVTVSYGPAYVSTGCAMIPKSSVAATPILESRIPIIHPQRRILRRF